MVSCPLFSLANGDTSFIKTEDGVIIYPDAELAGNTRAIRLQVITDNIIRVIASPEKEFPVQNSLITEFRKRKIPLDNIVLDWSYWKENDWGSQEFDASRFPNPDRMIDVLHKKYNTRLMISVWPKFYEGISV